MGTSCCDLDVKPTGSPKTVQDRTIVILSSTSGGGHFRAGENLSRSLQLLLPNYRIIHDVLEEHLPTLRSSLISNFWKIASANPLLSEFYSFGHNTILRNDYLAFTASRIFMPAAESLRNRYTNHNICAVVALHPGAAVASSKWKNHSDFLLGVVCTDLSVHAMQANEMVDVVFADKRSKIYSAAAQHAADIGKIEWGDLPINEVFFQKQKIIRDDNRRIVVTFGAKSIRGSRNIGRVVSLVQSARQFDFDIVCGINAEFYNSLSQRLQYCDCSQRVKIHGYVDDMHSLYCQSSAVIGKPGGLTVAEVTAMGLPFGILDWLPGQEERNIESLINNPLVETIRNYSDFLNLLKANSATIVDVGEQGNSIHAPRGVAAIAQAIYANLASREQTQRYSEFDAIAASKATRLSAGLALDEKL